MMAVSIAKTGQTKIVALARLDVRIVVASSEHGNAMGKTTAGTIATKRSSCVVCTPLSPCVFLSE